MIAAEQAYEAYCRKESLPSAYYAKMCPDRDALVAFYQATERNPQPMELICRRLKDTDMNYCRARICADILSELQLIEHNIVADTVRLLPVRQKRALSESTILHEIHALAHQ